MRKFDFICLFVTLVLAEMLAAQPVVHNYGSGGSDEYASIVAHPDGGFVAVGTTGGEVGSQTDVYLSKLNATLDCEWTFNIGGIGIERGNDVAVSQDGSIYFCGMILSNSVTGYKNLVGKVDANGNLVWSQEFGEGVWDEARNMVIDDAGNIWVATNSFFPSGEELVVLYSLDETGTVSTPLVLEAAGINSNAALEYYNSELYVLNNHDEGTYANYSVLKLDASGSTIQSFVVPGLGVQAHDLQVWNYGVFVVGEFLNGDLRNPYTCAFNLDGTVNTEIYNVFNFNMWYNAVHSNSEGYTIAGETTDFGFGEQEWVLHRANVLGQYAGGGTIGTNKFEVCRDLLVVNDTVYLVGSSNGFQLNKQQQATVYRNESVVLSALDPTSVNNDCFYVGTEDLIAEERLSFNAIGNNFFQASSQVKNLKVQVYSIDGKLTFSHSGSNEFQVNASPGIYFLVFQSEKQSGVQKIIIR
ncbi:MAG: T9SS type A sorting domain-containing protein [Flavobacteriales bacterium]|nr:T9SS type A sorting domain-containing protein [Flavobacteriales bacterium]